MNKEASSKSVAEHLQNIMSLASGLGVANQSRTGVSPKSATLENLLQNLSERAGTIQRTSSEPVRTLHHLSCTGGTLITKCIASMANTLVLNEIDMLSQIPFARTHNNFTPTDLVSLLYQSGVSPDDELIFELFTSSIRSIRDYYQKRGQALVLRDHSHSHYLFGPQPRSHRTMRESLVHAGIECVSLVTVRDPVDSYHSMFRMGWHSHMQPSSFEEYCRRYVAFLNAYPDVPTIKYEDFVERPKLVMQRICAHLQLSFFDGFEGVFGAFQFSGDSGRGSGEISMRPSLELPDMFVKEIRSSETYPMLCQRLDYPLIKISE